MVQSFTHLTIWKTLTGRKVIVERCVCSNFPVCALNLLLFCCFDPQQWIFPSCMYSLILAYSQSFPFLPSLSAPPSWGNATEFVGMSPKKSFKKLFKAYFVPLRPRGQGVSPAATRRRRRRWGDSFRGRSTQRVGMDFIQECICSWLQMHRLDAKKIGKKVVYCCVIFLGKLKKKMAMPKVFPFS